MLCCVVLKPKELLADVPVCAFAKDLSLFGASLTHLLIFTMSKYVCRVPSRSCLLSCVTLSLLCFSLEFSRACLAISALFEKANLCSTLHMYIHVLVPMYVRRHSLQWSLNSMHMPLKMRTPRGQDRTVSDKT